MSTTGLTTGGISSLYTVFGKLVLLGLIQLGAIGYMTLTSFFILSGSNKISTIRTKVLSAEFSKPEFFELKKFIKNVIIYTFAIKLTGMVSLWICFHNLNIENSLWSALFHSVSAWGTVGLSMGITPNISDFGKIVLTVTMFLGKVGALTLGIAFFRTKKDNLVRVKRILRSKKFIIILIYY